METPRKRKRHTEDVELPRITYEAGSRLFDRLFEEVSLEEMKDVVRKKIGLDNATPVQLAQVRGDRLVDLEDDADFDAFRSATRSIPAINIKVTVGGSSRDSNRFRSHPYDVEEMTTTPKKKVKKNKILASRPSPDASSSTGDLRTPKKRKVSFAEMPVNLVSTGPEHALATVPSELTTAQNGPEPVHADSMTETSEKKIKRKEKEEKKERKEKRKKEKDMPHDRIGREGIVESPWLEQTETGKTPKKRKKPMSTSDGETQESAAFDADTIQPVTTSAQTHITPASNSLSKGSTLPEPTASSSTSTQQKGLEKSIQETVEPSAPNTSNEAKAKKKKKSKDAATTSINGASLDIPTVLKQTADSTGQILAKKKSADVTSSEKITGASAKRLADIQTEEAARASIRAMVSKVQAGPSSTIETTNIEGEEDSSQAHTSDVETVVPGPGESAKPAKKGHKAQTKANSPHPPSSANISGPSAKVFCYFCGESPDHTKLKCPMFKTTTGIKVLQRRISAIENEREEDEPQNHFDDPEEKEQVVEELRSLIEKKRTKNKSYYPSKGKDSVTEDTNTENPTATTPTHAHESDTSESGKQTVISKKAASKSLKTVSNTKGKGASADSTNTIEKQVDVVSSRSHTVNVASARPTSRTSPRSPVPQSSQEVAKQKGKHSSAQSSGSKLRVGSSAVLDGQPLGDLSGITENDLAQLMHGPKISIVDIPSSAEEEDAERDSILSEDEDRVVSKARKRVPPRRRNSSESLQDEEDEEDENNQILESMPLGDSRAERRGLDADSDTAVGDELEKASNGQDSTVLTTKSQNSRSASSSSRVEIPESIEFSKATPTAGMTTRGRGKADVDILPAPSLRDLSKRRESKASTKTSEFPFPPDARIIGPSALTSRNRPTNYEVGPKFAASSMHIMEEQAEEDDAPVAVAAPANGLVSKIVTLATVASKALLPSVQAASNAVVEGETADRSMDSHSPLPTWSTMHDATDSSETGEHLDDPSIHNTTKSPASPNDSDDEDEVAASISVPKSSSQPYRSLSHLVKISTFPQPQFQPLQLSGQKRLTDEDLYGQAVRSDADAESDDSDSDSDSGGRKVVSHIPAQRRAGAAAKRLRK